MRDWSSRRPARPRCSPWQLSGACADRRAYLIDRSNHPERQSARALLNRSAARIAAIGASSTPVISSTWRAAWWSSSSVPGTVILPRRVAAASSGVSARLVDDVEDETCRADQRCPVRARARAAPIAGMVETSTSSGARPECASNGAARRRRRGRRRDRRAAAPRSGDRASDHDLPRPQLGQGGEHGPGGGTRPDDDPRSTDVEAGRAEGVDATADVGVVAGPSARGADHRVDGVDAHGQRLDVLAERGSRAASAAWSATTHATRGPRPPTKPASSGCRDLRGRRTPRRARARRTPPGAAPATASG